jgi:hypothetical protein
MGSLVADWLPLPVQLDAHLGGAGVLAVVLETTDRLGAVLFKEAPVAVAVAV